MTNKKDYQSSIADMEKALQETREMAEKHGGVFHQQAEDIAAELQREKEAWANEFTAWDIVQVSRNPKRPNFHEYATEVFTDFLELKGDRVFSDDQAIAGGFARLQGKPVMLIGHNKGRTITENVERNFGSAYPDGYRKALRLMKLADKFNVPIITLIDTAGAYPGVEAEERGQAEAIARNLVEMMELRVPVISVVTGEGGSGGALGIGVGNRVLMLSKATYSVISPEGCAGILWRDGAYADTAAEALCLTAPHLLKFKVIDAIIDEPLMGAHTDPQQTMKNVGETLVRELDALSGKDGETLKKERIERFSQIGFFKE
ncbi:acetyl-CoA carboxylase carboxyltransferase subunit alpha [Chitinivibrio alkaliphilus]|uniref:Acetyl-coenzyme A carboxylase carboxyl transferase subunit alpha n=1 Tax=Chitinivibrio alkaliphilus ACht1 TaxID=1313304 RepID=U7D6H3_9BACT|nr:acetyl-CoA carboxylase carboxyltransferase subunit alpha [Chitinivibrio alkaliphilus]ERP31171.1 acetyl-CoA carboxylase, carboxyl transferase, alpha subunit [Chitinivibrio alkaliphilus ACht1]